MAENSKISWTTHTFNPWRGCTKVSPGCEHCYAETLSARNPKTLGVWGPKGTRVVASEAMWKEPVKWNAAAACTCGADVGRFGIHNDACAQANRPRVFCASLADVFEEWQGPMIDSQGREIYDVDGRYMPCGPGQFFLTPRSKATMQDVRVRLFKLIEATPNLDWLVLTKRPENFQMMTLGYRVLLPNFWLGVTVENQKAADARIPILLKTPVLTRFLSCEPLLGPVNLDGWLPACCERGDREGWSPCPHCINNGRKYEASGIHWVIAGGESGGEGVRPMYPAWARSLRDQCRAADVPFHFKQWGEWSPPLAGEKYNTLLGNGSNPPAFLVDDVGHVHCTTEASGASGVVMLRHGKRKAGRVLDGQEWNELPLNIRSRS